jgi:thiosulfate reductase cytochrome b subunit
MHDMPLRQQLAERLFLVSAAAAVLMAADLAVKATVPTMPWHFHQRSNAWEILCVVLLLGALALARIPSRAVAIGAGVMSGGVAGNLLSARANDNRVPNPLVIGDYATGIAFNAADIFILVGNLLLMVSLMAVTIRNRDRLIPPRRWKAALRRRFSS